VDFTQIIAAATGGLVTVIAGYVGRRITQWIDTKEEQETARERQLKQLTEDIAALHTEMASMQKKFSDTDARLSIVQDGVLALSRDRMVQSELHFLQQGDVPMQVKENLNQMYIAYHRMGGNGVVTEIHLRFMELPTTI